MNERKEQAAAPPAGRRGRLAEVVVAAGLDAMLVTGAANVRYLTGFTGSAGWLLLAAHRGIFITDRRYELQAAAEVADADIQISTRGLAAAAAATLRDRGWRHVGFEAEHLTVAQREKLGELAEADWRPFVGAVEKQRRRKDAAEIAAVRNALRIAEAALVEVATHIGPGDAEIAVAAALEAACRRRGASGMAFETIVAAGSRTSLPHGVAGEARIAAGEPVMIDLGCRSAGYCSDLTRMVWCGGEPAPAWLRLYEVVDAARRAAIAAVAPGVAVAEVDAAARRVIEEAGFAAGVKHGTGHGVGLEIHEAPALSERSDELLEVGMVLTVEPGIYHEGTWGARIEDMAVVTEAGCERLTTLETEPMLRQIS